MVWFKRLMWALVALLVLLALGLGWYVQRSLPRLDGAMTLAGLKAPVQVRRDAADVTHLRATSLRDAAFALGVVHAQERGWQLEFNRRVMEGTLSEVLGEPTLETDKLIRTLGILRAAQRQWEGLPPDAQALLQAYADGINALHASNQQALPPEFHILRTQPGLWKPQHSLGWAIMMALDLGGNWGTEFARLQAARVLDTQRLWELHTPYPGEAPASATDLSRLYRELGVYLPDAIKTGAGQPIPAGAGGTFDAENRLASAGWAETLSDAAGHTEGKGSNNWVIAGSRTASGKPLLANDPHLGLSAPAIWYFARLQAPGLDVIGATLPGLPFVVLGRTARVAWGFTNTGPDVQDLYLEQINPANPAEYRTPTGWAAFASRAEVIKVKGKPDVTFTVRETRHGPVLSDAQAVHGRTLDLKKYVLSLRWSALDADNQTVLAGLRANHANSVGELLQAWSTYHSPMQNVVMADVDGRIAYKAVGKVPLRHPANDLRGVAPSPGWDAKYDWTGWLPYDQTPQDDGGKGWVSTANQRITAPGYPHFLGQDWAVPYRFDRIETLLAATPKHTLAGQAVIQGDLLSLATQRLLPVLRKTTSTHVLAPAAQAVLKDFDGTMSAASAAPLIFAAWADELARGLIAPKLGGSRFNAQYGKRHFRVAVEGIMERNDTWWCAPRTCAQQSTEALDRALTRLRGQYGPELSEWQWGRAHFAASAHRPFSNVGPLARLFDVNVPTGGDTFTVNVGQYWPNVERSPYANRHAASLRTLFDLSDLEKSQFIYQTGQSGVVFSSRYRDMRHQWAGVQYRALQLNPGTFTHSMQFNP